VRAADAPATGAATGAATAAAPLARTALPAEQRRLLQRHADDWDTLLSARQHALARGAERWLQMDPTAQARARERRELPQRLGP